MNHPTEQSSFRLGSTTNEKLSRLARAKGLSQTAVLRQLIAQATLQEPLQRTRDHLVGAAQLIQLLIETSDDHASTYQRMLHMLMQQIERDFDELRQEFSVTPT